MIVVDTSALVAILLNEPDAELFQREIQRHERALIGAATAFELHLVMYRRLGRGGQSPVHRVLVSPIEIVPWTPELLPFATDALHRFGGRPARLNYGDCMAYALAKSLDLPLLFKGQDFAATDVRSALAQ